MKRTYNVKGKWARSKKFSDCWFCSAAENEKKAKKQYKRLKWQGFSFCETQNGEATILG